MLFNAREMNIYYTCLRQRKTLGTKVINQDAGGSAVTVLVFITLFPISISNNILTNANGDKTKTLTVLKNLIELYLHWSVIRIFYNIQFHGVGRLKMKRKATLSFLQLCNN